MMPGAPPHLPLPFIANWGPHVPGEHSSRSCRKLSMMRKDEIVLFPWAGIEKEKMEATFSYLLWIFGDNEKEKLSVTWFKQNYFFPFVPSASTKNHPITPPLLKHTFDLNVYLVAYYSFLVWLSSLHCSTGTFFFHINVILYESFTAMYNVN